ncbi:hypothetical protein F5J12DRAFT_400550 [Pisolithus orientalis]|uniref:uncharacterized protein n=1 Tax=Pisolithus orientalis TaxID=936130 RepID=UPI002225428C|nr:uncharacterized protein F5J12DRAFT_400550 [Pisolithus orientalis]KAI6028888.1 hypothetical protein F5J12DRAFT_400550 [Pisolithus orientalis]
MACLAGCLLNDLTCTLGVGGMTEGEWFHGTFFWMSAQWPHFTLLMLVACQEVSDFMACLSGYLNDLTCTLDVGCMTACE